MLLNQRRIQQCAGVCLGLSLTSSGIQLLQKCQDTFDDQRFAISKEYTGIVQPAGMYPGVDLALFDHIYFCPVLLRKGQAFPGACHQERVLIHRVFQFRQIV